MTYMVMVNNTFIYIRSVISYRIEYKYQAQGRVSVQQWYGVYMYDMISYIVLFNIIS